MLCENCGKENQNDQTACDNCGANLTGEPIAPTPVQQQGPVAVPPPLPPQTNAASAVPPPFPSREQQPQQASRPAGARQTPYQTSYQAPPPAPPPAPPYSQTYGQPHYGYQQLPPNFAPLTTWGFMWTLIVTAIPIVGFFVVLVWAFSDGINRNRRNYARACLWFFVIAFVISMLVLIGAGVIGTIAAGTGAR